MKVLSRSLCFVSILFLTIAFETNATQIDYKGHDRIEDQKWTLEFTMNESDDFCVRFPYPEYTMAGRWATYATESVNIDLDWDYQGTTVVQEYHYNEGYSNRGVWIEVLFPSGPISFTYEVIQSVLLNLPGTQYGMAHHTENGWMCGTDVVDVDAPIVEDVLSEALALQGDWHQAGYWSEPEKIVNWLNINMEWVDYNIYELEPPSASYILNPAVREGNCNEWAHAACALFLKAGIPAKVVLVGGLDGFNETYYHFPKPLQHICVSYWDGYGWIMIDPKLSSGFAYISRVFLGADQDSRGIRIITSPAELILDAYHSSITCVNGTQYGLLRETNHRCQLYTSWEILEHYSFDDSGILEGTEPLNCIIPDVTSVEDNPSADIKMFFVNYPNPFNPVTTFRFNVIKEGKVNIEIYSVDGKHLDTVLDKRLTVGKKEINWFADGLSSGIYFARFECPSGRSTRKVIVLK
ncbi:MAG: T9SS type A sorting domain-containing protein [Candidatus Latescibacteria bacterium]|nr:T9SS type A sorting domain-containing protein [Candidatus Latescibacterota bacterium]